MRINHHGEEPTLEQRMDAVEERVTVIETRPLVSTKQVMVTCVALLSTVFAAGAWAQAIHGKQNVMQVTLERMANDLKQLSQVERLQDRMERMEKELDRLRETFKK